MYLHLNLNYKTNKIAPGSAWSYLNFQIFNYMYQVLIVLLAYLSFLYAIKHYKKEGTQGLKGSFIGVIIASIIYQVLDLLNPDLHFTFTFHDLEFHVAEYAYLFLSILVLCKLQLKSLNTKDSDGKE